MSTHHIAARCPAARTLGIFGDTWSLLIVREAFGDVERFDAFRSRLQISEHTLSRKLAHLVAAGVLYKERNRYSLTEAGRDLAPVLVALGYWGRRWRPIDEPDAPLPPALAEHLGREAEVGEDAAQEPEPRVGGA